MLHMGLGSSVAIIVGEISGQVFFIYSFALNERTQVCNQNFVSVSASSVVSNLVRFE